MIPMSRDARMVRVLDGVEYTFRPPVGTDELLLHEAMAAIASSGLGDDVVAATKRIKLSHKSLDPNSEKFKTLVLEKAYKLSEDRTKKETGKTTYAHDREIMAPVVDRFLCGWNPVQPDTVLPKFPSTNNPSECMDRLCLYGVYNLIQQLSISEDDTKN